MSRKRKPPEPKVWDMKNMPEFSVKIAELNEVSNAVWACLKMHDPRLQLAVIANAAGGWIAGHVTPGNPEASWRHRADALEMMVGMIKTFTELNVQMNHPDIADKFAGKH